MNHKCSPCGQDFATEAEYLAHECPAADGAAPTTVEYLKKTTTPLYDAISQAAQQRGKAAAPATILGKIKPSQEPGEKTK